MNEQKPPNFIEWTRVREPDGTVRRGFTWNPIAGCLHECEWVMPDGAVAECYAKTVAERLAQNAYEDGFQRVYWHGNRLSEPLLLKDLSGIFVGSMTDIMQKGVRDSQIELIFNIMRAPAGRKHIFFMLTKNAPRLLKFKDKFPDNLWVGVSMPPSRMYGKEMTPQQQERYMKKALFVLRSLKVPVRWISFEPLSWDVGLLLAQDDPLPFEWAVIGAASNGARTYQPEPQHVEDLVDLLDDHGIPVFMKGNLQWPDWREDFPGVESRRIGDPVQLSFL